MREQFKAARRAAVPVIGVETADQQSLIRGISRCNENVPVMQWDILTGLSPLNQLGAELVTKICGGDDPAIATGNPVEMLTKIMKVPEKTITFMNNSHRFLNEATVSQGICNLRDVYKASGATVVLVAP